MEDFGLAPPLGNFKRVYVRNVLAVRMDLCWFEALNLTTRKPNLRRVANGFFVCSSGLLVGDRVFIDEAVLAFPCSDCTLTDG